MAKVKVIICSSLARTVSGDGLDIPRSAIIASKMAESTTVSQIVDISGDPDKIRGVATKLWCVISKGWILVKMGTGNVTITSDDDGWMVPPGVPMFFSIDNIDETIAIRDV